MNLFNANSIYNRFTSSMVHYGQIVLSVHCPYNTKIKIFERVQNERFSVSIFWNINHVGTNLFCYETAALANQSLYWNNILWHFIWYFYKTNEMLFKPTQYFEMFLLINLFVSCCSRGAITSLVGNIFLFFKSMHPCVNFELRASTSLTSSLHRT